MALKVNISAAGTIRITIDKRALSHAAKFCPSLEEFDDDGNFRVPRITDPKLFAKSVFHQILCEEEDGTTIVHRMFDEAIINAVEQGAEGIVLPREAASSARAALTKPEA